MTNVPGCRACALALLALALCSCAPHGRTVFAREGCAACHRFRDAGGGLGPALDGVRDRLDAAAIRAQITAPASRTPASRMPAFPRLSWFDLHSLAAYLRS